MLCVQLVFNLSGAAIERRYCPLIAIFCATVAIWYVGVRVTFPYILDSGVDV